ncbi:9420_t:CDS:2, partial [Gigaspora margarita]
SDFNKNEHDVITKSGRLEEETQGSKQNKQDSRDKQTGPETGNQEDIKVTEENNITEILNEEIQIDEEVN